jgi:acetyl/propionyl-CoA carboxylase alpha subunit
MQSHVTPANLVVQSPRHVSVQVIGERPGNIR